MEELLVIIVKAFKFLFRVLLEFILPDIVSAWFEHKYRRSKTWFWLTLFSMLLIILLVIYYVHQS